MSDLGQESPVLSGALPLGILFGVLGVIAISLLLTWWLSDRRRWQMRSLAMRLGWTFKYAAADRIAAALQGFSTVPPALSDAALCTLTGWLRVGNRRLPAQMGDHACQSQTPRADPRQGKTGSFSYLAVQLPCRGTPELVIRHSGMKDLAPSPLGPPRVSLESEAFNRKFAVRCDDKKFAFDVLHPRMMEFLMAGRAPTIEIRNGWLCITDGPRHWRPAEFAAMAPWAERFLAQWPEYLWENLEYA